MAEQDYWAQYNPQPADAIGKPAEHSPESTAGSDYWAKYMPQPASQIDGAPPAMAQRLAAGTAIGNAVDKSGEQQEPSWHNAWDEAKKGYAAGADVEQMTRNIKEQRDYLAKYTEGSSDTTKAIWDTVQSGYEQIQKFSSVAHGILTGAAEGGAAGVNAYAGKRLLDPFDFGEAMSTPIGPGIPSVASLLTTAAVSKVLPLALGREGVLSRIHVNEDTGALEAKPVGQVPKPGDFVQAAQEIAPKAPPDVQAQVQQRLQDLWHDYGRHPNEVVEAAQNSEAVKSDVIPKPQSVGAAASPSLPLGDRPAKPWLRETDDRFFALRNEHIADKMEMQKRLQDMGEIDREKDERLYQYGEGDPHAIMEPEDKAFFDEHLKPLQDEQGQLFARLSKAGFDDRDIEPIMHRMVKGKTPEIDQYTGQAGTNATLPQEPVRGAGLLSRTTSSLQSARYYAAVNAETGQRHLVEMGKDRMSVKGVKGGTAPGLDIKWEEPIKVGDELPIGSDTYRIERPYTREIEEATPTRYHKSAVASLMDNVLHLRAVDRATYTLQALKNTPEWEAFTRTEYDPAHPDWESPNMPLFKNFYMDPKIAHIIDDFWGDKEKNSITDTLEKINRFAINSLFFSPIPHALNHLGFWATERGWDWLNPTKYVPMAVGIARSIKEVATQGKVYQDMMRSGASLQYGPIATRDFLPNLLKNVGQEIEKQEGGQGWAHLAEMVGMPVKDLVAGFYDNSNKILWAAGDVMKVQRIQELEDKGMTRARAIQEVEKFTPAYRFPHEIMGDRGVARAYGNNILFQFSRYHWDIMKMYGNMVKDLAVGNGDQRKAAAGVLFGLAAMQLAVWPGINAMWQHYVSEEQRVPSFGPGRLTEPMWAVLVNESGIPFPKFVKDYYSDYNRSIGDALRALVPISPEAQIAVGALTNRAFHSGRNIVEPDDWKESRFGRVAAQAGQFAAGTLAEPYKAFSDYWRYGETAADALLENIFGMQNNSADKKVAVEKSARYDRRAAKLRARKPLGPIESLGD